jgi:hypothetical protein
VAFAFSRWGPLPYELRHARTLNFSELFYISLLQIRNLSRLSIETSHTRKSSKFYSNAWRARCALITRVAPTPQYFLWVPNWLSTSCGLSVFGYQPAEQIATSEAKRGWQCSWW